MTRDTMLLAAPLAAITAGSAHAQRHWPRQQIDFTGSTNSACERGDA